MAYINRRNFMKSTGAVAFGTLTMGQLSSEVCAAIAGIEPMIVYKLNHSDLYGGG